MIKIIIIIIDNFIQNVYTVLSCLIKYLFLTLFVLIIIIIIIVIIIIIIIIITVIQNDHNFLVASIQEGRIFLN